MGKRSFWELPSSSLEEEDIVEWAEREVYLPADAPMPGRITVFPYQKEILRTFMQPDCFQVTNMMSTQVGKTEVSNIIIGRAISEGRSSIFSVHATQRDVNKYKAGKFDPMVEACPILREKVSRTGVGRKLGEKQGKNNQITVSYTDGHLTFAHSHSPGSLRSTPALLVIADEVDEYPGTTDSSDPIVPLIARTLAFGRSAKIMLISSPKVAENTIIGREYEKGDKRRYWVPCPYCSEYQVFDRASIFVEEDNDLIYLVCKACGIFLEEKIRRDMIYDGEWRAEKEFRGHASFHLNQLYSLLSPVQVLFDKYDNIDSMGFYNNFLAIPWSRKKSEPIEESELDKNIVDGRPEVFNDPHAITCGVDVQGNRIEYQICEWVNDYPLVMIHRSIDKPIAEEDVWQELYDVLSMWQPDKTFVDGGYRFEYVKDGLDKFFPRWIAANKIEITKGRSTQKGSFGMPIVGNKRSGYVLLSPDEAKMRIMFDMIPNGIPFINKHGVPSDFITQLTAEHLETIPMRNGDEKLIWVNHRDRNEALDCQVLNLAAKISLGANYRRMKIDYDELIKKVREDKENKKEGRR